MPKEVLMPQFLRRARLSEPTLFHPHPHPMRPYFQTLPHDIQHKTIRLLARLLRFHADQRRIADARQEAGHE
jgi:hypothetical protein